MSPGIVGLYWLAGSFIAAGVWPLTARGIKNTARRAAAAQRAALVAYLADSQR